MTEGRSQSISAVDSSGSRNGQGADDHDQSYCFSWRPPSGDLGAVG